MKKKMEKTDIVIDVGVHNSSFAVFCFRLSPITKRNLDLACIDTLSCPSQLNIIFDERGMSFENFKKASKLTLKMISKSLTGLSDGNMNFSFKVVNE